MQTGIVFRFGVCGKGRKKYHQFSMFEEGKQENRKRINSLKNQQAQKFLLPGNYIFHLKI